MPGLRFQVDSPRCRVIFPDWTGGRPFSFHLMEELLEARRDSMFPTNGAGPDEDVNVYLAGLLAGFLEMKIDPRVQWGAGPLLNPPESKRARRATADWYRANADHRLLYQGLMDRGDGMRRHPVHFGMTAAETNFRDRETGRRCYGMAANLLAGRPGANNGLTDVLRKLETNYDDYIHVLGVLATRRLGMGAVLNENDLAGLLEQAG